MFRFLLVWKFLENALKNIKNLGHIMLKKGTCEDWLNVSKDFFSDGLLFSGFNEASEQINFGSRLIFPSACQ